MAKLSVSDRITRHFDDFDHRWREEFNGSKARHGKAGTTGSSAMIRSGFAIFETELQEMLARLLAEISNSIRHRGRAWRAAHYEIRLKICESYPNIATLVGAELGTRGVFEERVWTHFGTDIASAATDTINAHESGFTSPQGDPIPVRFPVAYAAACGLLGALGGAGVSIFGEDIRNFTFDLIGTHQSSPGTQPASAAPETSPPPGADTPAA